MHRLPRWLAWVVSVVVVAGMLDDTRSLLLDLLGGDGARFGVLRLMLLVGLGGSGLALAFRPRWAPLPFSVLVAAVAWRPESTNLHLVALLLLALAAALLDWARLSLMVVPYLVVGVAMVVVNGAAPQDVEVVVAMLVAVVLGRAIWIMVTRKERAQQENETLVRQAVAREEAAAEHSRILAEQFETQRRALSHELHDVIAHELTRITMQATVAAREAPDPSTGASFRDLAATARRGLGEMRRLMAMLSAQEVDDPAQVPRSSLGSDVDRAVTAAADYLEQAGLNVHTTVQVDVELPHSLHNAAEAVLREASTNAAKHSPAGSRCELAVHAGGDAFRVQVRNEVAVGAVDPMPDSGFGLSLVRARVESLGGTLQVGLADDWWVLTARWPLDQS